MSRVSPLISFMRTLLVKRKECTSRVSIDTIHETQTLPLSFDEDRFDLRAKIVECGIERFRIPSQEVLVRGAFLAEVIRWSLLEAVNRSVHVQIELTGAVSLVIAAEQGKQYVSSRTVRSVS